ncbi:MAG: serine/threonine-protein kinase, partial [Halieaceae bacterium]
MAAVALDLEGDRLGPYRLIQLIRRGGQGTLYLGYDDRLRRRVAIKLLTRPNSRKLRKQLVHEARTVASLDNPHLVKIYDVVLVPPYVALVMEYVPGCDLEQLLAVTTLSQASILSIASDIASALASARQRGVVHGDVKAANVLITREGRAKLTDFGISRDGSAKQEVGAGSIGAVSPEQLRGEPLDVRADLFALGCLLYRMLSGKHPYMEADDPAVYQVHGAASPLQAHALDGSLIDRDLRQLVDALVQRSPDQRPGSTQEVRRVVRAVRRNIPMGAGNTLLDEARPWFRRETAIAEIASAAAEGLGGV